MSWIDLLKDQRRWAGLTIVLLALGIGWTFLSRLPASAAGANQQTGSPRQGFAAPDFTLDLLGGGSVTLSDLRGQPVMVNLWASWCIPCRLEMPAIQKVYNDYRDLGLVVLAVNATNQDSAAKAAEFVRDHGLTFPVPLDRDGSVSALYALRGLPTTFFIDRDGVVRSVVVGGPMSEAAIRSKVEELLKESP